MTGKFAWRCHLGACDKSKWGATCYDPNYIGNLHRKKRSDEQENNDGSDLGKALI